MSNKSFLLFLILAVGTVVLMIAWPSLPAPSAKVVETEFVPQILSAPNNIMPEVPAEQLLDLAISKLDWDRTKWLKTRFRQVMRNKESAYVAEGSLVRGPSQCVRFELNLPGPTPEVASRLLVVSDGEIIAQESAVGKASAAIVSDPMPEGTSAAREAYLASKGCGGPVPMLRHLRSRIANAKAQTGVLQGQPVIMVHGDYRPGDKADAVLQAISARTCAAFLDAKTLWPIRLEWRGGEPEMLQMNFFDWSVNHEMSLDDCIKQFSYQPSRQ